jgi:hypothetical protein
MSRWKEQQEKADKEAYYEEIYTLVIKKLKYTETDLIRELVAWMDKNQLEEFLLAFEDEAKGPY